MYVYRLMPKVSAYAMKAEAVGSDLPSGSESWERVE